MVYKQFKDKKLSMLGLGTMRLPILNDTYSMIDEEKTAEMVEYAMKHGINYYDTAWGYHDGQSERVIGKILNKYPRESYYIATKFPGYDLSNMDKVEEIFEQQLEKTGMEYFDFYLIHNVCEINIDSYLDEKYRIREYLLKQLENGRIKHLGFSVHGNYETTSRFLEVYGEYMEFGQIQLNYIDYDYQNAKAKIDLLSKYNIPIWVMEPLRGGKLATMPEEESKKLENIRQDETVPGWAFRFLQTFPEVKVILSGMSNMEQLVQNIETFEEDKPLNDQEYSALMNVAYDMIRKIALPCTSCRYCTTHCPKGLDIPNLLELYNKHMYNGASGVPDELKAIPNDKWPTACVGCKSCEKVCPQSINITEALAYFAEKIK